MIKAIFFDVDGTLLSFKTHRVPESAVLALKRVKEKGIKLFVASGRRKADIDQAGLPDVFDGFVTLNGGRCVLADGNVVFQRYIAPQDIERLIAMQGTPEAFPCVLVTEEKLYINFINDDLLRLEAMLNLPMPRPESLEKWADVARSGVSQMLWFFSPEREEGLMKHFPDCRVQRWSDLFADVIPEGVGKDVGISRVVNYLGIRLDDTMAFGDGGNDISMLHHVGTGVAMGDAPQPVKEAADYVTASADEDGIALALEHFGLL